MQFQLVRRFLPQASSSSLAAVSCFSSESKAKSFDFASSFALNKDEKKESPKIGALSSPLSSQLMLTRAYMTSPSARLSGRSNAMLGCFSVPKQSLVSSKPDAVRSYYSEAEYLGSLYSFATRSMFISGILGAAYWRRNMIIMLLCSEVALIACSMNFLFASAYLNDMAGLIFSISITTISACETAIGLALCVGYFHLRSANEVEALNLLK